MHLNTLFAKNTTPTHFPCFQLIYQDSPNTRNYPKRSYGVAMGMSLSNLGLWWVNCSWDIYKDFASHLNNKKIKNRGFKRASGSKNLSIKMFLQSFHLCKNFWPLSNFAKMQKRHASRKWPYLICLLKYLHRISQRANQINIILFA